MYEYTSYMKLNGETFNRILDLGCFVMGGFPRDGIILQEPFNDIDIICDLAKKDELVKIIGGTVISSKKYVTDRFYTTCRHMISVLLNDVIYDIRFFDSVQDWKDEKSGEFTTSLFYIAKDHLGVQFMPEGETLPSLLDLVRNRHIKVLYKGDNKGNLFDIRERKYKFVKRGWKFIG